MTEFPELFSSLMAPILPGQIKILPKAGGKPYITARTVQNRLDEVLGPENWTEEYVPTGRHNSVMCRLTITLPDGSKLTKCDAGGSAGIQDGGDDDKSAHSDALKRAAVKFGIGRELYRDGVAKLTPVRSIPPRPLTSMPQPASGKALYAWAKQSTNQFGIDVLEMVKHWGLQNPRLSPNILEWDIGDVTDCRAAMAKELDARGLLSIPPEARAQMPQERPQMAQDAPEPGPLTFDPRDRMLSRKTQIKDVAKRLFVAAFQEEPTESRVMEFIKTRCKEHRIVVPDSIRNLSSSEHLGLILKSLQEDEADMRRLA